MLILTQRQMKSSQIAIFKETINVRGTCSLKEVSTKWFQIRTNPFRKSSANLLLNPCEDRLPFDWLIVKVYLRQADKWDKSDKWIKMGRKSFLRPFISRVGNKIERIKIKTSKIQRQNHFAKRKIKYWDGTLRNNSLMNSTIFEI